MSLSDVSNILWKERHLLELLLFKLDEELLLAAGRTRWLTQAALSATARVIQPSLVDFLR